MFRKLHLGFAAGSIGFLSACMVTPDYQQADLIRSVKFKAGVSFTPPVNYCIDPKLVQDTETAGFAVVLPCLDAVEEVQGGFTTVTVVLNEAAHQTALDISAEGKNQKNLPLEIHFQKVQHSSAEQILGMQDVGWQLIDKRDIYTSVLTLYVPNYVTVNAGTAEKHLKKMLNRLRYIQTVRPRSKPETRQLTRPRARPLS